MTTADIVVLVLVLTALAWLVARLVRTVRLDGLGQGTPPRSHPAPSRWDALAS